MHIKAEDLEIVVELGADIAEGPTWDAETGTLIFVDTMPGRIYRYDPITRALSHITIDQPIGAAIPRRSRGLVVAVRDGIGVVDESSGALEIIAPIEADLPDNRMNDAKCDSRGRLWTGSLSTSYVRGAGALYRIDPDHRFVQVATGVSISNGIAWSPDETRMYFNDTRGRGVDVFDYDIETGAATNRRRFVAIDRSDGLPDGMTVDADGHVWVVQFRGGVVRRYSPSGEPVGSVSIPVSQVTSCAFGGPDLRDLYITSATHTLTPEALRREPLSGAVFRCRPGVAGMPANAFAG